MYTITPPRPVAHAALRALKGVALADGHFHELEYDLLNAAQEYILHTDFDLDALLPITPEELADIVPEGPFRERMLNAAIVVALIDGEATKNEGKILRQLADALEIDSQAVTDVERLAHGWATLFRLDTVRRGFSGQRAIEFVKTRGLAGAVTLFKSVANIPDPKLAARYQALADYPKGTLGREYYRFTRENGFALPGEKGGPPEPIVFHDCLHVLGEYGTSAAEECEIVAFQAANITKDPVFSMFFALAQFQLGLRVTPVDKPTKMALKDPARLLRGYVRGSKVTKQLCLGWQPWDDFARTCDELRTAYNIVPRENHA